MKIICAHNYYQQPGGEDASFQAQVALLRANGHEVFTFTRNNSDAASLNPVVAAARTIWSREAARELGALISKTGAQVVHFHNTFMLISPAAYYACRANRVPVIQDLRNYRLLCPVATFVRQGRLCEDCLGRTPPWPSVLHACWRHSRPATAVVATMLTAHRVLGTWDRQVDAYIALTETSRQRFIEGGLPPEKIEVKPNFLDPAPPVGGNRSRFALYVGRLSPEKGIETMLEAWRSLGSLPLKIAGDGPLAKLVRSYVGQTSNRAIEWLGHIPHQDVLELMRQASVLVFPSVWNEPFGNSIIEAFASGLPVIASNMGSMAELVADHETGLHFRPGDAADLASKLRWARDHRVEMGAMGLAARHEYERNFTAAKNHAKLMDIYHKAKETHDRQRGSG